MAVKPEVILGCGSKIIALSGDEKIKKQDP
jgi:hypothetical protein